MAGNISPAAGAHAAEDATLRSPAPNERTDTVFKSSVLDAHETAFQGDCPNTATQNTPQFVNEIQALKLKILELERKTTASDADPSLKTADKSFEGNQPGPDPQFLDEIERYKRMEQCLYRHRKEWERQKTTVDDFSMILQDREYIPQESVRAGPWQFGWDLKLYRKRYERPDPFDHNCLEACGNPKDVQSPEEDEFDRVIDYGYRRERLRRNFEWEVDRLFLAEEADRRRRLRAEEKKTKGATKESNNVAGISGLSNVGTINPQDLVPSHMDWAMFKSAALSDGHNTTSVLQILVGDPINDYDDVVSASYPKGRQSRKNPKVSGTKNVLEPTGREPMPERIRVNSFVLIQILSKIIGGKGWASALADGSVVFVRPFKAIVYYEGALREWCVRLEKKFSGTIKPGTASGSSPNSTKLDPAQDEEDSHPEMKPGSSKSPAVGNRGNTPALGHVEDMIPVTSGASDEPSHQSEAATNDKHDTSVPQDQDTKTTDRMTTSELGEEDLNTWKDPDDVTSSSTALAHLKCLLSFIDSDILARKAYVESPESHKVQFPDLWLLFQPGTEVIRNDGKQAYRVIEVSTAAHRVMTLWDMYISNATTGKNAKKSQPPFSLTCVCIDFDGKHLGPVKRDFHFRRFEGERDVTSFEVFPLRFYPERQSYYGEAGSVSIEPLPDHMHQQYRQQLMQRGAKFLDVVAVKHMDYAGPTLSAREEIESQVVVDFETAFSTEDKLQQQWRPTLDVIVGDPAQAPELDGSKRTRPSVLDSTSGLEKGQQQDGSCRGYCCREDNIYEDKDIDRRRRIDYISTFLPKDRAQQPSVTLIPRLLNELKVGPLNHIGVSEDELVIMSYRVFGFVLRSRKWEKLDITYMAEVQSSQISTNVGAEGQSYDPNDVTKKNLPVTAFDRLVLEKGHRPMIESLVSQHFRNRESATGQREQADIVKGKGKGLIILLHGAPGVGKTSTAEGVAEMFRKPLFQITCGDLGTTAREVEMALETNFALASRWGCILLLDEADVFLSARTKEDFIRNGLVAAFLRVMEYYTGILFLTTNRVGDFDEAFTSRIHISLYYPELSQDKTVQVFKLNMDMMEERFRAKGKTIEMDKVGIGSFASQHFVSHEHARWNGRQIRNACQTALALAEFEAQGNSHHSILKPDAVISLGVGHFETVQKAYLEFARYMHKLFGTNSSRRAKEERLRAIWIDENDRVVATQGMGGSGLDKKEAFLRASHGQSGANTQQAQPVFQHQPQPQVIPQHQGGFGAVAPQQPQQYYQYATPAAPATPGQTQVLYRPSPSPSQVPPQIQHFLPAQQWNSPPGTRVGGPPSPFQGFVEGQVQESTPTPPPMQGQHNQQQPAQMFPPLDQGIQAMYAASGQPGAGQLQPSSQAGSSAAGGAPAPFFPMGGPPGHQWEGR
ncbi:hypothetical protein QBC44DRAFT_386245 [Cladorrhinum sp. PSN332]|nr:hypothetical protein QBC44DRAFT_386245 [Cladorrhinum sp. PSN332]